MHASKQRVAGWLKLVATGLCARGCKVNRANDRVIKLLSSEV